MKLWHVQNLLNTIEIYSTISYIFIYQCIREINPVIEKWTVHILWHVKVIAHCKWPVQKWPPESSWRRCCSTRSCRWRLTSGRWRSYIRWLCCISTGNLWFNNYSQVKLACLLQAPVDHQISIILFKTAHDRIWTPVLRGQKGPLRHNHCPYFNNVTCWTLSNDRLQAGPE